MEGDHRDPGCMRDPDVDHGFVFDDQGRTDILGSPFFDVYFGTDETADDYVNKILYQLMLAIEQHNSSGRWYIVNRPSTSPDLATSPVTSTRGVLLLYAHLIVFQERISSFSQCNHRS
ncbi:hypothetical protein M5K25_013903 [Dendrobium thyrsiflorum]|uniref:Uncharacterized protein n=1 Tax=Dendrobium thyrsiflorum TaxID=117978 RepID=A0ABD0UUJ4_DENTH